MPTRKKDDLLNSPSNESRRNFLKGSTVATGAFVFGFSFPLAKTALAQAGSDEVNAWVVVQPDETVLIRIARIEMGQGSLTGLAQLVAEELECDWDNVGFELVKPGANLQRDNVWKSQSTGGSTAIRGSHEYLRKGGATARAILVEAAARQWQVPAQECKVNKGVITHSASNNSTTFGSVAALANGIEAPENIELKDPSLWTIAGKPLKRLDTKEKVDGSMVYTSDLTLPGMLIAIPKACPVHGGTLASFDAKAVLSMPGVKKVVALDDNAVAVVADTFWHAKKAIDALPVKWNEGENAKVSSASIAEKLHEGLSAKTDYVGNNIGDAANVLSKAANVIEADYSYPYQNHAPMEPMSATVRWRKNGCEMWGATQVPESALGALAEAAELPKEVCEVHTMRIGGSFGRRLATDYVRQAALVAKQIPDTPIKLLWTREEDMLQGHFHPVTQCRMRATLDDDGTVQALHMRISGQSILAHVNPNAIGGKGDPVMYQGVDPEGDMAIGYSVPNLLVDQVMVNPHIRPGFWRGVNLNQNALYMESFIDELAHAAGQDPLAFRRKLMANHPKHLAVLEAAAKGIGWDTKPAKGIYRGIAQVKGFGSYVAAAAEVSVTDGKLKIHRIVAATDPGYAINPQQIEAQVAGSFVYGLSPLLSSECTVKNGRIEQENFHTYQVMQLRDMPEVEVITMPSGGFWGGVGEPTIAVAAPAVLNAIFAATGKRVRNIPIKNTDLSAS
ncbi:molybdopterin-dependent oxidoreductase [Gilvimarinus sp. SDUM040013]|uniref:Molybdopterin cofactor-binding domain-containing protein n=1 Tax=Gilvimarinus gilvus TaxID=3058038 RepID=A0ABU4S0D1_9GAMM|nr:molybdopterin cofactor-binding domain-containing protein [Gilvimarinus sp. SDUM040013]MDO3385632.1 molybdopterin-dependent oxidoreductase [Gilvimarinus sp. SDUM040013]MDX6849966.1 molybdopterin cofactor-binding domain-containing protein [Gilvimarinus sp. SDUM040013]